jgi:peptidoglycan-associated lipoprotein
MPFHFAKNGETNDGEREKTMLNHKGLALPGLIIALVLAPGCATETSTQSEARTSPSKAATSGRDPSAKAGASQNTPASGSSLDAHRAGKTPTAGPLKEAFFEFDSYNLTAEARSALQANAAWLKANPAASVEIEGHCDERGTTEYNLALGAKRARAALDYLVSLGISPARIKATSYGEELPVCREATESCYQKNRRDRLVDVRTKPAS